LNYFYWGIRKRTSDYNLFNMEFRGTLIRCVRGSYDRGDVNLLVKTSYGMATSYLKMKLTSQKSFFLREERIEDLAWDFIADLFQKSETGDLIALQSYFERDRVENLGEEEALIELRKLVFTKVDDNVFRYYGERDPSLRKIIRNLKLAIRDQDCKNRVCYRDGHIIVNNEVNVNKPGIPVDFMRIRLCARLNEKYQIPDVLIEVIDIISSQSEYRQRFPLVALASIIRESYVIIQEGDIQEIDKPLAERNLFIREFDHVLNQSASRIRQNIGVKYVQKGKLCPSRVESFFYAAAETVKNELQADDNGKSQYEQFCEYAGCTDYSEYRREHRPVFEYIVKLIREDVVSTFRKEWARF